MHTLGRSLRVSDILSYDIRSQQWRRWRKSKRDCIERMGDDRFPRAMVPAESKYPPDTLHLSLLNPRSSTVALCFLTTDASPRRTEGAEKKEDKGREKARERTIDLPECQS